MSIGWMNHVWEHSQQKGTALLLLLAIADHANDDGLCWPSVGRLAEKARTTKRQAQRLIAELEAAGELVVERGDGRGHTSIYHLKDDIQGQTKGDIYDQKGDTQRAKGDICANEKSDICDQKGDILGERVTSSAIKGDIAMSPDPSLEPSSDPSLEPTTPNDDDDDAREPTRPETVFDGPAGPAFQAWVENIRIPLTPLLKDRLRDLVDDCGLPAVLHGVTAAAEVDARSFKYIETCARNHAAGREPPGPPPAGNNRRSHRRAQTDDERRASYGAATGLDQEVDFSRPAAKTKGQAPGNPLGPPSPLPRAQTMTRQRFDRIGSVWDKLRWELGQDAAHRNFNHEILDRIMDGDLREYSGDCFELCLPAGSPWADWVRTQALHVLSRTLCSIVGHRVSLTVTVAEQVAVAVAS